MRASPSSSYGPSSPLPRGSPNSRNWPPACSTCRPEAPPPGCPRRPRGIVLASPSNGGRMGQARAEIEIGRPAGDVWGVVGDFGGIAGWMPGVESCTIDGDDRILAMMGMEITERLERRDDDDRVLVYRIVGGVPVENHKATI